MANEYLTLMRRKTLPNIPLEGSLDLTYRCNNNCRHCWAWLPPSAKEKAKELSFEEIKRIVGEARNMGCREWTISGGEPMLKPDFAEIFDYITSKCSTYSLNTNGTMITPKIAKLMRRKGKKMVALYGATAKVNDYVTRNPGSFEATMRGIAYLKEAGAGFVVQLVPMQDNYHQFKNMVRLAKSLSRDYRIGAAWLFLSMRGDSKINQEIMRQRLSPEYVVQRDIPDLSTEELPEKEERQKCCNTKKESHFFNRCIAIRRDFDIDPYGGMTFCCFIRHPKLRYDLRKGSFKECWEKFIPSLAHRVKVTQEYKDNCGSCELREECYWCPAYGYLEHRRFSAKVDYFCAIAREAKRFKEGWRKKHRRCYNIAGIDVQIDSDLPITEGTFHPKFKQFEAKGPGEDMIAIRHHFSLPDLDNKNLGEEVYRKPPWAIYKRGSSWIYLGISRQKKDNNINHIAVFNQDHTRARIYNKNKAPFLRGRLPSLTLFPTDQILLARVLADREGFYLHSCGVDFRGKGFIFAGHSGAGKSTMAAMLKSAAEILCDDRIIVRRANGSFRIYGTWSHGDMPDVSAGSAPLKAVLFLQKAQENHLIPLGNKKEIFRRLLPFLARPFVTADWWERTLNVLDSVVKEIPFYVLRFDKSGGVKELLKQI